MYVCKEEGVQVFVGAAAPAVRMALLYTYLSSPRPFPLGFLISKFRNNTECRENRNLNSLTRI
jgi:hypothetical protein